MFIFLQVKILNIKKNIPSVSNIKAIPIDKGDRYPEDSEIDLLQGKWREYLRKHLPQVFAVVVLFYLFVVFVLFGSFK